ncbi:glucuronosyltransferase [Phenylobacterium deserti]|nr:glucuronosyltransferase [Phenylobacterium deserti]
MTGSRRVLAVASAGGHWTQMMRLTPALQGCDVVFVSTLPQERLPPGVRLHVVPDANRNAWFGMVRLILSMGWVVLRERPDVVISTGAAPGYVAIRLARLFGARTVWLDSLANVDQLSMSGRLARAHADLWLTQWPHVAKPEGPHFLGSVI